MIPYETRQTLIALHERCTNASFMRMRQEEVSSSWRIERQQSKRDGIEVEHGKLDRASPREAGREGAIEAHRVNRKRLGGQLSHLVSMSVSSLKTVEFGVHGCHRVRL